MRSPQTISLGYKPRAWQGQVHAAMRTHRFVVTACHRRGGKTKVAEMELVNHALQTDRELALFAFIAPMLKQAKSILWPTLKQTLEPLRIAGAITIREDDLSVTFHHNQARIRLFGIDNADSLRGLRLDGCVLDEIGFIAEDAWTSVIRPCLADRKGWMLAIGTPSGGNLFSEMFRGAASRSNWTALRFTVDQTEALDQEEVEFMRAEMSPQSFERELMCSFDVAADDQLISVATIEAAASRSYTDAQLEHAPIVLGVDVARFGSDASVIVRRQGLQCYPPQVMRGADLMVVASAVADQIAIHDPDAVFVDSTGIGSGVVDRLRQIGHRPLEVVFGGMASKPQDFRNKRMELWDKMREWLEGGGALPADVGLRRELSVPTFSFDSAGRRVLESKDSIRRRLSAGASPDAADALACTFAVSVSARRKLPDWAVPVQHGQSREYDPFAVLDREGPYFRR